MYMCMVHQYYITDIGILVGLLVVIDILKCLYGGIGTTASRNNIDLTMASPK